MCMLTRSRQLAYLADLLKRADLYWSRQLACRHRSCQLAYLVDLLKTWWRLTEGRTSCAAVK